MHKALAQFQEELEHVADVISNMQYEDEIVILQNEVKKIKASKNDSTIADMKHEMTQQSNLLTFV